MYWPHKDLLRITELSPEDILQVFQTAEYFAEINTRPVKKIPVLKGKTVALFFAENSTRTRTSFDLAAKRLSADSFTLTTSGSSLKKGESLKDTALTLQAMHIDALVIRHQCSGAAEFLATRLDCPVINAGDGWHAHPTQALLDGFTLYSHWGSLAGKTLCILGDIAHSRVARSDVQLFSRLGAQVRLCAPRTLLPAGVFTWPATIHTDPKEACANVDAILCLRLQLERQQSGLLPNLREYTAVYGLSQELLRQARPDVCIMHPGPINRGLEIASEVADSPQSCILDQVGSGVTTRMALLHLFLTRGQFRP